MEDEKPEEKPAGLENKTPLKKISLLEACGLEATPENLAMLAKSVARARAAYEKIVEEERNKNYYTPSDYDKPICAA